VPGGLGDVDPELFGQKKKYDCVKIVRNRCDFESTLLAMVLEKNLPLFGICWGFQMLNVHLGGTLIQDIRKDAPHSLIHESCETDQHPLHGVTLTERAATIAGGREIIVNSTHHQAIDKIAPNLVVEGRSSDGLIECVSLPEQKFAWAVQWHPERLSDDKFIPAFREACLR
jgi:putative glutamine amidotransferase